MCIYDKNIVYIRIMHGGDKGSAKPMKQGEGVRFRDTSIRLGKDIELLSILLFGERQGYFS